MYLLRLFIEIRLQPLLLIFSNNIAQLIPVEVSYAKSKRINDVHRKNEFCLKCGIFEVSDLKLSITEIFVIFSEEFVFFRVVLLL